MRQRQLYSVWKNDDQDTVIIIDGTLKQCLDAMRISVSRFFQIKQQNEDGGNPKYKILVTGRTEKKKPVAMGKKEPRQTNVIRYKRKKVYSQDDVVMLINREARNRNLSYGQLAGKIIEQNPTALTPLYDWLIANGKMAEYEEVEYRGKKVLIECVVCGTEFIGQKGTKTCCEECRTIWNIEQNRRRYHAVLEISDG